MKKKIPLLILGANGMLGSTLLRWFGRNPMYDVFGSVRDPDIIPVLQLKSPNVKVIHGVIVENFDSLISLFSKIQPSIVINCIGIVKQRDDAIDPLVAIPINALLPHRLALLAKVGGSRLIHMSTDCVFSGAKGDYLESDLPDACDLYGRTKLLGELNYSNTLTLRTSIIGHELSSTRSLIDWFLSQDTEVKGYKRAIFSGLPTVEIARIIEEFVLPNAEVNGVYHLSADPISKFDLLSTVARVYGKDIKINPDSNLVLDRSLNSDRFRAATGFTPPSWGELINRMREFK